MTATAIDSIIFREMVDRVLALKDAATEAPAANR